MVKEHVVFYSSGAGSYQVAKIVCDKHGAENVVLLFADTLIEDEDNYRFLHETASYLGAELVLVADGRTPWEVFRDKRWIGNSRVAQCSHELKQKVCLKWLREYDPVRECVLYIGIDWTEAHRLDSIVKNWHPWKVEAPLMYPPYLQKADIVKGLMSLGIEPPRLYSMGFAHANCGGFCVRGGKAHFANLYKQLPDRYMEHAEREREMREYLQTENTILTRQEGGVRLSLSLLELSEMIDGDPQVDMLDIGGCGCFVDYEGV
jgi:hypothetical protein